MAQVSANYFRLFGLSVARGRTFTEKEDRPNAGNFAVLSDAFWKRAFAGNPQMIGETISLSGAPYVVLGIMAPGVETESPLPIDVWTPFQIDPACTDQNHYLTVAGRIRPGITPGMIKAQLQLAADNYRHKFPSVSTMLPGYGFGVEPMRDVLGAEICSSLLILAGAVSLVVLIACANVASLLLVRAAGRRREIAIRAAVGAGRGRIVRQLLTESLVLSIAGGALGLILGIVGIRALLALSPGNIPRVGEHGSAVTADWRVLAFTIVVSVGTGILCGLIPAIQASRADLSIALKDSSGRSGTGFRQNNVRSLLVAGEMALALILLIGPGLLIRTFVALRSVELGFDPHHVLTVQMSLTGAQYQKTAGVSQLARSSLERIRALPGVVDAAAGCCLPLGPVPNVPFVILGRPLTGSFHSRANIPPVSADYFGVFKIAILRGRGFTDRDSAEAPHVAIINEAMARRFWPNGDALGARITAGMIVGIAGNVHERTKRGTEYELESTIYIPLAQTPDGLTAYLVRQPFDWIVRTRGEPNSMASAIKSELQ